MKPLAIIFSLVVLTAPCLALAAEKIDYTYDNQGRVTVVAHTGTINNHVQASYSYDKADNRTHLTVTESTAPSPKKPK